MIVSTRFMKGQVYVFTQVKNRPSAIEKIKPYRNSIFETWQRTMVGRDVYTLCQSLTFTGHGENMLSHSVTAQHIFKKIISLKTVSREFAAKP